MINNKDVVAVIIAGGKGTRLSHRTKGLLPKSLLRLTREMSRPLISYQLDALDKVGISNVFIIFEFEWQIALFEQSEILGEVPSLNYSFILFTWSTCAFEFLDVLKKDPLVKDKNIFWSYGDFVFRADMVRRMLAEGNDKKSSVCCRVDKESSLYTIESSNRYYFKIQEEKIVGVSKESRESGDFAINAPYLFSKDDMSFLFETKKETTFDVIRSLIEARGMYGVKVDHLVNLNTEADVASIFSVIKN